MFIATISDFTRKPFGKTLNGYIAMDSAPLRYCKRADITTGLGSTKMNSKEDSAVQPSKKRKPNEQNQMTSEAFIPKNPPPYKVAYWTPMC